MHTSALPPLAALLLALTATPAAAEERASLVTETTLDRWQKELTPLIEAAAGRRFVERPKLTLATRAAVEARLPRLRGPEVSGTAAPQSLVDRDLDRVLGLYAHGTQEVYFLTDNVERGFVDHGFAPDLLHPVMRCVVAHELVHALQHQVVPLYESDDVELVGLSLSLREGHADLVAAQVCGAGGRFLDLAQGLDIPASRSPDDRVAFAYGYAETFVAALQDTAGPEAVWAALAAKPPPRALITRVGGRGLPVGWTDTAPLEAVARMILPASTTGVSGAASPASLLPGLAGDDYRVTDIPAVAGMSHTDIAGGAYLKVVAFLLRDEAAPAVWISRRTEALRAGRARMLGSAGVLASAPTFGPVKALARGTPGLDGTLQIQLKREGGGRYVEQWAARGRYLFGIIHNSRAADARTITAARTTLLAAPLPDIPTASPLSEDDRAALLALVPATPLPTGVSWTYRRDEISASVRREDWSACIDAVEDAVPTLDRAGRSALAAHAMVCALNEPDLGAADRYYELLTTPAALRPDLAVGYAEQLADARRWEEVLSVLDAAPAAADADDAPARATARLLAHVSLRRWAEAERLLVAGEASAAMRAWAASHLAQAGRTQTARAALRSACPALTGDERGSCDRLLAQLGG